jgi:uncharacterized glyoxalase superfamily protein PhnB
MTATRLESIAPAFATDDLGQALDFYQTTLGFDIAWTWGSPPTLAAVCRDSVEITLAQRADAQPAGPSRVYLRVTGIEALYERIHQAGARIVVPIGDRHYGLRDFRVADPDGNELDIGEVLPAG